MMILMLALCAPPTYSDGDLAEMRAFVKPYKGKIPAIDTRRGPLAKNQVGELYCNEIKVMQVLDDGVVVHCWAGARSGEGDQTFVARGLSKERLAQLVDGQVVPGEFATSTWRVGDVEKLKTVSGAVRSIRTIELFDFSTLKPAKSKPKVRVKP